MIQIVDGEILIDRVSVLAKFRSLLVAIERDEAKQEHELLLATGKSESGKSRNLNEPREKKILLLTGKPKTGKSRLLEVFSYIAETEQKALCVAIDLRAQLGGGVPRILRSIATQLQVKYSALSEVGIEDSSNQKVQIFSLLLRSTVNINMGTSRNDQSPTIEQLMEKLNEALVDLSHQYMILFLFDNYEAADTFVQDWMKTMFLTSLTRLRNVKVVVAGQTVPDPIIEWSRICFKPVEELQGITLAESVAYCRHIGADQIYAEERIQEFHEMYEGKPGYWVEMFTPYFLKSKAK